MTSTLAVCSTGEGESHSMGRLFGCLDALVAWTLVLHATLRLPTLVVAYSDVEWNGDYLLSVHMTLGLRLNVSESDWNGALHANDNDAIWNTSCFEHGATEWNQHRRWIVTIDGVGESLDARDSSESNAVSVIEQQSAIESAHVRWKRKESGRSSGWNGTASAHFLIRNDTAADVGVSAVRTVLVALWEEQHQHRWLVTRRLVQLHPQQSVTKVQLRAHISTLDSDGCRFVEEPTPSSSFGSTASRIFGTLLLGILLWIAVVSSLVAPPTQVHGTNRVLQGTNQYEDESDDDRSQYNSSDASIHDGSNRSNGGESDGDNHEEYEGEDDTDEDGEQEDSQYQGTDCDNLKCGTDGNDDYAEESSSDDEDWSPPTIERQADFVLPTEQHQLLFLSPLAAAVDRSPPVLLRQQVHATAASAWSQSQRDSMHGVVGHASHAVRTGYATLAAPDHVVPTNDRPHADLNELDASSGDHANPPAENSTFCSLSSPRSLPTPTNLDAAGYQGESDPALAGLAHTIQPSTWMSETGLLAPSMPPDECFGLKDPTDLSTAMKRHTPVDQATAMDTVDPPGCQESHAAGTMDELYDTEAPNNGSTPPANAPSPLDSEIGHTGGISLASATPGALSGCAPGHDALDQHFHEKAAAPPLGSSVEQSNLPPVDAGVVDAGVVDAGVVDAVVHETNVDEHNVNDERGASPTKAADDSVNASTKPAADVNVPSGDPVDGALVVGAVNGEQSTVGDVLPTKAKPSLPDTRDIAKDPNLSIADSKEGSLTVESTQNTSSVEESTPIQSECDGGSLTVDSTQNTNPAEQSTLIENERDDASASSATAQQPSGETCLYSVAPPKPSIHIDSESTSSPCASTNEAHTSSLHATPPCEISQVSDILKSIKNSQNMDRRKQGRCLSRATAIGKKSEDSSLDRMRKLCDAASVEQLQCGGSPACSYVSTLPPDSNCSDEEDEACESMSFSSKTEPRTSLFQALCSPALHQSRRGSRKSTQSLGVANLSFKLTSGPVVRAPVRDVGNVSVANDLEQTLPSVVHSYNQPRANLGSGRQPYEPATIDLTICDVDRHDVSAGEPASVNPVSDACPVEGKCKPTLTSKSAVDASDSVEYLGTRRVPDEVIPEMVLSRSALAAIESINESCWEYNDEIPSDRPKTKRTRRAKSVRIASRNVVASISSAKSLKTKTSASSSTTTTKSSKSRHGNQTKKASHVERFVESATFSRSGSRVSKRKKVEAQSG